MADKPAIFTTNEYSLVSDDPIGDDMLMVDFTLKRTAYDTHHKCFVCGNTPKYKLVPIDSKDGNEEIAKRGYLCEHHKLQRIVDPTKFKLKVL